MPFVDITNIITIRANLEILASFDGRRGLGGKGARKLHINTVTGAFSTKDGLYQNIFQRNETDSLLHADTIRTIRTMFVNAVKHMKTYAGPDKQRDETRKLLFRGVRGLAYLSYQAYRDRPNYNLLQGMIKSIKDDLETPLKRILNNGLTDQLWFDTGVQVTKALSFKQSDFLEDPMGGICYGICMDWCRRVLVKNKFSFKTSSKQNEWDELIREITAFQRARIVADMAQINNNINQDPTLTTPEARVAESERQKLSLATIAAEITLANKQNIQNMRYRKKGTYQSLAQHTQEEVGKSRYQKVGEANQISMETSMVSEKVQKLLLLQVECQSKIDGTYKDVIFFDNHQFTMPTPHFSAKEIDGFKKIVLQIENAVGKLGESFPLMRAAEKFSRMEYQETEQLNIPENIVLCMSDPSDFLIHLTPLINRCVNSIDGVTPKAFYLSFSYGGNYAGMDKSGGHALAFSKNPATNVFYAIDPNYGEFSSQTEEGLTFIFCVLLSHYSLIRNIKKIETATVSLRDVP